MRLGTTGRAGRDRDRVRQLFVAHGGSIHGYLASRVGVDVADDLTSEVFVVAFARLGAFDEARGDVRGWLFGIATKLVHRHRRDEAIMLRAHARIRPDPPGGAFDDEGEADRRDALVGEVIAALRPEHRDALFLSAVAGLSGEEIARALGVPTGTARAWLHRARVQAAGLLEAETNDLEAKELS